MSYYYNASYHHYFYNLLHTFHVSHMLSYELVLSNNIPISCNWIHLRNLLNTGFCSDNQVFNESSFGVGMLNNCKYNNPIHL